MGAGIIQRRSRVSNSARMGRKWLLMMVEAGLWSDLVYPGITKNDKEAKTFGNTAHILVPKGWVGKKVKVLLLEE